MKAIQTPEGAHANERTNTAPLGTLAAFAQATAPTGRLFVRSFTPARTGGDQHV